MHVPTGRSAARAVRSGRLGPPPLRAFWGWAYRFEAYTPAAKRERGYYALPLLWRDRVIGWGNLAVVDGGLRAEVGYIGSAPREPEFRRGLEAELERMRAFLRLDTAGSGSEMG